MFRAFARWTRTTTGALNLECGPWGSMHKVGLVAALVRCAYVVFCRVPDCTMMPRFPGMVASWLGVSHCICSPFVHRSPLFRVAPVMTCNVIHHYVSIYAMIYLGTSPIHCMKCYEVLIYVVVAFVNFKVIWLLALAGGRLAYFICTFLVFQGFENHIVHNLLGR